MKLSRIILSSVFLLFNAIITTVVGFAPIIADLLVSTIAGLATNYLWYEADKQFGLSPAEGGNGGNTYGAKTISLKREDQISAGISLINGFLMMIIEKMYARDYEMVYTGTGSRLTFYLPWKNMKFPRVCPYEISDNPQCKE